MIDKFRRISESWVVKGLFLLMAIFFAIMWGGGEFIGRIGSSDQTIITVGPRKISAVEFSKALNQMVQQWQAQNDQTLTDDQIRELGFLNKVRQQLIQETLLTLEAERLGIKVSDEFVRTALKKQEVFLMTVEPLAAHALMTCF